MQEAGSVTQSAVDRLRGSLDAAEAERAAAVAARQQAEASARAAIAEQQVSVQLPSPVASVPLLMHPPFQDAAPDRHRAVVDWSHTWGASLYTFLKHGWAAHIWQSCLLVRVL